MTELEAAALRYARAGLPVFPAILPSKAPLTKNGFHDATTQPAKVGFWFRNYRDPNTAIAIATGHPLRAGGFLMVLDMDPPADGDYSLAELEGERGPLPDTWQVTTPRGGTHFYFRTREPMRCAVGFRPGLDVRGKGGYVLAPPSRGYSVEVSAPIDWAPEWLLDAIRPARAAPLRPRETPVIPIGPRYVQAAIERECMALAEAPEGTRNDTLNVAAFRLARFVVDGQAHAEPLRQALRAAATAAGLTGSEIERTLDSAFRGRGAA